LKAMNLSAPILAFMVSNEGAERSALGEHLEGSVIVWAVFGMVTTGFIIWVGWKGLKDKNRIRGKIKRGKKIG